MQADKKYDAYASVLSAIDNISNKFMEYQKDKEIKARDFASKIDKLNNIAKTREQLKNLIRPQRRAFGHAAKQSEEDTENNRLIKADEEANKLLIDTSTVVDGLLSSPAGDDREFLLASTTYLRHKNNEKNRKLTSLYIQDMRDTYLIRLAKDAKTWDLEYRELLQKLMAMVQNVALSIRKEEQRGNQNQNDEENETKKAKQNMAQEFDVY